MYLVLWQEGEDRDYQRTWAKYETEGEAKGLVDYLELCKIHGQVAEIHLLKIS